MGCDSFGLALLRQGNDTTTGEELQTNPPGGTNPGSGSYPLHGEDLVGVASVLTAEYGALRQEIGRYQDHHHQLMNFAFLVIGAMFGIVAAAPGSGKVDQLRDIAAVFLFFPYLYAVLAVLY